MRRRRKNAKIRDFSQEVVLHPKDFIMPIFVDETISERESISSMPGIYRYPLADLRSLTRSLYKSGVRYLLLFGLPKKKDEKGSSAYNPDGIVQKAIKEIKSAVPEFLIITDVCLCSYTNSGHCGILGKDQYVNNDETCQQLSRIALSHAKAGADIVAPSDMMDGRVSHIRRCLDENDLSLTSIMSYAAKYSSSFYGPFREAADCAPSFGDRKTYQMNSGNIREALEEVLLDVNEGADYIIVKPALSYGDVIHSLRENILTPIIAYNVSGEYAMIKACAEKGWIQYDACMYESLLSMKRAGADKIISYATLDMIHFMEKNQ